MKDKENLIDSAKNFSILFLLISALFLMFKAVIYEPNSAFVSLFSHYGSRSENASSIPADFESSGIVAEPVFVLVTTEDGSHNAVKYDTQSKDKMFMQFSGSLGEALGSSRAPKQISDEEWQQVLGGSGIFFDYVYPQPLSAVAQWLGTKISDNISSYTARRLFLGNKAGTVMLYFISEDNHSVYCCETASSFSSLSPKITEYPIGSAKFAFELGEEYTNLDSYFIFSDEKIELRKVEASNPFGSDFSASNLLSIFGINSRSASEYPEKDGSKVYVEGGRSLRIDPSGMLLFSVTGNNGIDISQSTEDISITDSIEVCSKIAENSLGLISGDCKLGLIDITNSSSPSTCNISYGYFIGGVPVTLPNGSYAANFQISGGVITRAEFYFRHYKYTGDTLIALPEKQAAAISKTSGGQPLLTYEDKGNGVICTWIIN